MSRNTRTHLLNTLTVKERNGVKSFVIALHTDGTTVIATATAATRATTIKKELMRQTQQVATRTSSAVIGGVLEKRPTEST